MNPFAVLESDDEDETFTKVQSHKKTDNKKKQAQKPANNAAPTNAVSNTNAVSDKKNARGGGGRGDNRSRGRGTGRGGKETGDRIKNGKREYDRRSGTGRGTEVAKGGAGKGGWGTNQDEIAHQRAELEEENSRDKKDNEDATENVVQEEPEEPEAPTFTLDEFLARRDASRQNSSVFSAIEERKVSDDFSGMKAKGNDNLDSFIALGGQKSKNASSKSQRSTAQTKVTDLGFHAAPKEDFREDRGDRGGRGGKGGRGRGRGDRGGRGGERRGPRAKVDLSDQSAFPSL